MNKIRISVLSFIMALAMVLSLFSMSVSATTTDPASIDKVIVDLRSEASVRSPFSLYKHTPTEWEPDPLLGGKYSFDDAKQALKLEYSPCEQQNDYRLMLRSNKGAIDGLKYAVIVYMAKTSSSYRLNIWNTHKRGDEAVFEASGKDTAGKFVITEPVNIEGKNTTENNYSRWNNGGLNTVNFITTDKNAEFYIKEVGFFRSPEDAKAYYAAVDLSKPSSYYGSPIVKFNVTEMSDDTDDGTAVGEPVIVKMGSTMDLRYCGASYYTHGDNTTEGRYEAATVKDRKSVRLFYEPHAQYPYSPYRCMPRFNQPIKLTAGHKYVRITYLTTDNTSSAIVLQNNASHKKLVIVPDASVSGGEWTVSPAVRIDTDDILKRFTEGRHCILGYDCNIEGKEIYIAEMAFFTSEKQAYEYYGDSSDSVSAGSVYSVMTFGNAGTGAVVTGTDYGTNNVNFSDNTVDISYAESTNAGVSYMAKVKFLDTADYDGSHVYVRALYSAKNPEGVEGASLLIRNDKIHEVICLEKNLTDTDGFVLSDVTKLPDDMKHRFDGTGDYSSTIHNSVIVNHIREGGEYRIKALYFFPTRAAAEAFEYTAGTHKVSINGTDISNFRIVIPENAPDKVKSAASIFSNQVEYLTGTSLSVVNDSTAASANEILIGNTNREASQKTLDSAQKSGYTFNIFAADVTGTTVVINANLPMCLKDAVNNFLSSFLYKGLSSVPSEIKLNDTCDMWGLSSALIEYGIWDEAVDVADPTVLEVDFSSDEGYFTEENGADEWKYKDGAYVTDKKYDSISYIHVYEKNVNLSAKLTAASKNGEFGLIARYCSPEAYVKAGYDFERGEWYIESREGVDFFTERVASKTVEIKSGKVYELALLVHNNKAELKVDGKVILSTDDIHHLSPGRAGIYSHKTGVTADDFSLTLLSGEGTILTNVWHTKLPDEQYREGGSVFEMKDGSLIYQTHFGGYNTFKSTNNGKTWKRTEKWAETTYYPNVLRLTNGDFIKVITQTRNGKSYKVSQTSSDDGKTWVDGGIICYAMYNGSTNATATNMNDKVSQSPTTGRIFYCQNYEVLSGDPVDGRNVFCEFWYSDDNGKSWKKSETDSWEIKGNETETHFGECKILECADGTLRMYNSWNAYGCIVYSESKDGGVTWGPLVEMPEFVCARSSMQFWRDPYADSDHTYYMVWVYSEPQSKSSGMARSRLSLAKSTDGKNWEYIGDLWRWESNYKYNTALINHIVDPFVMTTEDYVIVGTGLSERVGFDITDNSFHQAQRQHIWSVPKASLPEGREVVLRENLYNFTDVTTHESYYEAVKFAVDEGLFNGTSETTFSPATTMNRAMFVTVLGRLDKADVSKYTTPTFDDVKAGQWYTSYVEWAAANGIVNGMGSGKYGVTDTITVEQACTILYRYNGGKTAVGDDVTDVPSVSDFTDGSSVSAWAADGVKWAIENSIYEGVNGKLNPTSPASRALVATMFANYVKAIG